MDDTKITEMELIVKRLVNWYAKEETSYFYLHRSTSSSSTYLKKRWERFMYKRSTRNACNQLGGNIECAHELFTTLAIDRVSKIGPSLYCKNCAFSITPNNEMKFGVVFYRILLPLALDYHIWSRTHLASCKLAKVYHCGPPDRIGIESITSKDNGADSLRERFDRAFGTGSIAPTGSDSSFCPGEKAVCVDRFKDAIDAVNIRRKEKIMILFEYIKNQGFTYGSAVGSLGHQMLTGSGFMHAAFLMRNELESVGQLDNIIETMKWYNDFGEVYQADFEYKGTTADRVRTTLLFRLLTVLAMPQNNEAEKKSKLRDMDNLKRWIDNALTVNEGLLGLIKPDYTGFHHSIVYEGAYIPDALHIASLVSYLLDGTQYELNPQPKSNIENALKLLRTVAVKYSTPPSVNGRYPEYNRAMLGKHLPAYAYLAVNSPNIDGNGNLEETTLKMDKSNTRMFLRLYADFTSGTLCHADTNLCNGKIGSITFLNTLGAAELLEDIKTVAATSVPVITSEVPPSGNWAKNYAALSIHRRDEWAVTVKGFNNFVFGPERYKHWNENEYGLFANHGAMLIANDETSLSSKDVSSPEWDWTKIPGTTAIQISRAEIMAVRGNRYSNPQQLAGGSTFLGSSRQYNGVFGMDFSQPAYVFRSAHPLLHETFEFKKSVFFFDDYLVGVGSGISSTASREVYTTLFQDKIPASTTPPLLRSSHTLLRCNDMGDLNEHFASLTSAPSRVILVDVNGNRYYVPDPKRQKLVVEEVNGYCRAWFDHETGPTSKKYEYLVQINAEPASASSAVSVKLLLTPDSSSVYTVLQDDSNAHVVKFNGPPVTYGFAVFQRTRLPASSPVSEIHGKCLMMAEESSTKLYLSISYPHLNLARGSVPSVPNSGTYCADAVTTTTTAPSRASAAGSTYLFCSESQPKHIDVKLHAHIISCTIESIKVDGKVVSTADHSTYVTIMRDRFIRFTSLQKGFTTEVTLSI